MHFYKNEILTNATNSVQGASSVAWLTLTLASVEYSDTIWSWRTTKVQTHTYNNKTIWKFCHQLNDLKLTKMIMDTKRGKERNWCISVWKPRAVPGQSPQPGITWRVFSVSI